MSWFKKKQLNIQEFAHSHRNYLVIVADPKDDTIFVSYKDKQISGKIKSMDGKDHQLIKKMLAHSTFETAIDRFIAALTFHLKAPIKVWNSFYQVLDGALFNITKSLQKRDNAEKNLINDLMKDIIATNNIELYKKNISKFTSSERVYLESKLTVGATAYTSK